MGVNKQKIHISVNTINYSKHSILLTIIQKLKQPGECTNSDELTTFPHII
jgi:hypothetical protein